MTAFHSLLKPFNILQCPHKAKGHLTENYAHFKWWTDNRENLLPNLKPDIGNYIICAGIPNYKHIRQSLVYFLTVMKALTAYV